MRTRYLYRVTWSFPAAGPQFGGVRHYQTLGAATHRRSAILSLHGPAAAVVIQRSAPITFDVTE